ncbi:MAG: hypothetical protein RI907_4030 [Pseudomonadota bacterium]|jgi:hypothetical protein
MTFKRALVGLAAAAAFASAHAAVPVAAGPGSDLSFTGGSASFASAFVPSATFGFDLAAGFKYDLGLSFYSIFGPVTVSSIVLAGPSGSSVVPAAGTASFTGLKAGSYDLTFNFAPGSTGFFTGTASLVATPVPEAETTALALAGLGVVGLLSARRRKQA